MLFFRKTGKFLAENDWVWQGSYPRASGRRWTWVLDTHSLVWFIAWPTSVAKQSTKVAVPPALFKGVQALVFLRLCLHQVLPLIVHPQCETWHQSNRSTHLDSPLRMTTIMITTCTILPLRVRRISSRQRITKPSTSLKFVLEGLVVLSTGWQWDTHRVRVWTDGCFSMMLSPRARSLRSGHPSFSIPTSWHHILDFCWYCSWGAIECTGVWVYEKELCCIEYDGRSEV